MIPPDGALPLPLPPFGLAMCLMASATLVDLGTPLVDSFGGSLAELIRSELRAEDIDVSVPRFALTLPSALPPEFVDACAAVDLLAAALFFFSFSSVDESAMARVTSERQSLEKSFSSSFSSSSSHTRCRCVARLSLPGL